MAVDLASGVWTEVTASAPASFVEVQNQGPCAIRVALSASAPSAVDEGFILGNYDGYTTTSGLGSVKVYARPLNAGETGAIYARAG